MAQVRDRLLHAAGAHQQIALHLPEIAVVGPLADEALDLGQRCLEPARAALEEAGDGAGVACRQALVRHRIAVEHGRGPLQVARQLGAHQVVAQLQLGIVLGAGMRACLHELAEPRDAIGRHGMAAREGVLVRVRHVLLLRETLEGLEHAAARLARRVEVVETGLIGRRFRERRSESSERMMTSLPPTITPWPAPLMSRSPATAPPIMAPMPSSWTSSARVWSLAMRARNAAMCPPAIWPASCAMTPITSFGVLACISVPVWMNTLRPSSTNALNPSLRTMRMATRPVPRPAARKMGRA